MNYLETEAQYTSGVYGKREVVFVRGEGSRLWDDTGREYIDCASGISVANVGHAHPTVVAAITKQAGTLLTAPELAYNDVRAQLLARLANKLPDHINRLFLCNSGAEANEGCIKFARLSTGRPNIVATMRGFHGRTLGALSATHNPKYRKAFYPLVPGFSHVPYGKLEKMDAAITDETAAVILEVVQGEGGVRPGDSAYLQAVQQLCHERGALLIVDEVQTGFGRTGKLWGIDHFGLQPDLMALGKAMAGGVPMGAVAIGDSVDGLKPGMHGSTFGGNPLACAAALAVLDILDEEGLVERSAELGAYFRERLEEINSPLIREVRGLGLMIGVEMKERVGPMMRAMQERGIVVLNAGPTVLRFLPPLVITKAEIDQVVENLMVVLSEVTSQSA